MTTYKCTIGDFEREIKANTAAEAAEKCVRARTASRSWFANESPQSVSVMVDGVEYQPAAYSSAALVWGR